MKCFQETTQWDNEKIPNHIYFLSDSKSEMYAYVMAGTNVVKKFVEPIRFHIKGRKFKEVPNTWKFSRDEQKLEGETWNVVGSKGNIYTVSKTQTDWSCTCPGFQYKSDCKHIKSRREM